jgi:hypothetical protein
MPDKHTRAAQQLGRKNHNRRCPISDLLVLKLAQLYQHLCCRVLDLELLKDSRAIIGNCDIANVIDKHFVEALRSKA